MDRRGTVAVVEAKVVPTFLLVASSLASVFPSTCLSQKVATTHNQQPQHVNFIALHCCIIVSLSIDSPRLQQAIDNI